MNFFPGIYESKRTKKATSFSNPLSGAFYSNKDFLKNCRNVPRSISQLDHIKQIKFQTNNEQSMIKDRKYQLKKNSFNKQESKRMQRQIVAIHATARMAEPINKTFNENSILRGTSNKVFESETLSQTERTGMTKTFTSIRSQRMSKQLSQQSKKILNASNNQSQVSAQFNDIEILLLDLLDQKQDFRTKIIRINLQKYFRSFFKKQLSGHFTLQFLSKVQQHIDDLLSKEKLDEQVDQQQHPIELFTISSRMSFMNKLLQFEAKKTAMNEANVRAMIKFYCIPSREFRESCLRDILLMLSLEVFEKFNCSRQEEYVILDEFGNEIKQIMQIKFSTKKLFLTSKKNASKNFNNYLLLLDEFYREGKKLTFTENMKLNFRKRLTQGNFDESHFNYTQNYEMEKLKRYVQLQNAQQILKKRTQTHRVNKFIQKQLPSTEFIRQQSNQKLPISNEIIKNQPAQYQKQSPEKSKSQEPFWKQSDKRISPEIRNSPSPNRNSKSPTKNNSPLRSRSSMKKQDQISKEKLQQFLNNDKKKNLDAQMQKSFRDDFKDFVSKNDTINFHFNHHFKNRILKDVLIKYFVYFQDKSDLQMNKIFKAIKSMNVQVNNDNFEMEKSMRDYQVNAQNTQVENDLDENQKSKCLINSLSWEEFRNLKTIVACSEPKDIIMDFIAKYLNFNEFGELSKEDLFDQVQFILGEKCDQSAMEVIAEVIWSWFQSNSIVENGFIRRMTLESWYEKYKIVYFMLVSLIFGTNHKTILDLAYEVLV